MTTPTISSALPGSPVASKPECVYAGHTPERSKADFFAFNEEYLRRLKEGEEATERHFVVYFSPLVLMKLKQRLRNREELEDLRQDVFLRVFQSLRKGPGLRRAECLGAYVHSICANVVLEYLRRRGRTVQWSEDMPEPRDRAMSIEYKLVTDEVKEEISKVLDEMSPRDRYVLRAILLEERDKDSVCRELGVTQGYIRVLLCRALVRFKRILKKKEQPIRS